MHFPVIGECLGWRTTDFEELYGDLGQWTMTKELAREVSCFYLSSHCEVWWIAESILNMSRSRADGTMSSWLLYFRNFTNFHTVSYIIWTPLWAKCASAPAILSNISANANPTPAVSLHLIPRIQYHPGIPVTLLTGSSLKSMSYWQRNHWWIFSFLNAVVPGRFF